MKNTNRDGSKKLFTKIADSNLNLKMIKNGNTALFDQEVMRVNYTNPHLSNSKLKLKLSQYIQKTKMLAATEDIEKTLESQRQEESLSQDEKGHSLEVQNEHLEEDIKELEASAHAEMLIAVHGGEAFAPGKDAAEHTSLPAQANFHSANRTIPKKPKKPLYMREMSTFDEGLVKHHFYTPKDTAGSFQGHPCSLTIRQKAAENVFHYPSSIVFPMQNKQVKMKSIVQFCSQKNIPATSGEQTFYKINQTQKMHNQFSQTLNQCFETKRPSRSMAGIELLSLEQDVFEDKFSKVNHRTLTNMNKSYLPELAQKEKRKMQKSEEQK